MAKKLTNIPTNLTEYPNSFKRLEPFPLEAYEIFYSKESAKEYATNNPLAYVGQTIKVVENNTVDSYIILNESGELYPETFDIIEINGGDAYDAMNGKW